MNTVRKRLMAALTVLLVAFLATLFAWQCIESRTADQILANSSRDKAGAVAKILSSNSLALRGLGDDCAQNSGIVEFAATGKRDFITPKLAAMLQANRVAGLWAYRAHSAGIHWTATGRDAIVDTPLSRDQLSRLAALPGDHTSFIWTPRTLVELAVSQIGGVGAGPKSGGNGYIVLERSWNGSFLNTIETLSGCGVKLTKLGSRKTLFDTSNEFTLRTMDGPDGTPLATLTLTGDTTLAELVHDGQASTLWLFASFAVGILGFLFLGIVRWVSRPLEAISASLESQRTDGIRALANEASDFGRLALLVCDFFGQNRRLVDEVAERRRAEDDLRTAREELEVRVRERTAELVAANEAMRIEVAERLRAVDALRAAETKYRSIFENSVEGIFQMTPDGIVLDANPAFARILGYETVDDMQAANHGPTHIPYVDIERRETFKRIIEQLDIVRDFELQAYRATGEPTWLAMNARVVRDTDGAVVFYEGTIEDVSERKRNESEILRLNTSLEGQISRIVALRRIDIAIGANHDLTATLQIFLTEVQSQLGVDAAAVLLCDQSTLKLKYAGSKGFRTGALRHTHLSLGAGQAGKAALNRRKIHIPDLTSQQDAFGESPAFREEGFVAYIAVPLVAKGQVKGVLEVFHRGQIETNHEWLDFLDALAGQAAIAIDNASLFEGLQRSNEELTLAYDATIEGWSRALDLRDKETEGHSKRVTEMAVRLGRRLGLSDAELVQVRRGALLHDIGKMGIPDQILLKPAPLTEDEWHIMRKHPTYAYEMLSPVEFLRPALDIPYCHHEKWDGTGYPRNMAATDIPIAARIFALVDVWDALRSDRPYRKGWTEEQVTEHVKSLSGKHFDPEVVEAFVAMVAEDTRPIADLVYLPKAA